MNFENVFNAKTTPEKILTPEERMDQEKENYLKHARNCGTGAYHVFSKKLPAEEMAAIYETEGHNFETTIAGQGFIPCGNNIIAGSKDGYDHISSPREYIQVLSTEIKQWQTAYENCPPISEEEIKKSIAGQKYTSSVDGQQYDLTVANHKYYTNPHMKGAYEVWVDSMKETLTAFGKTALRFQDYQIAKEALVASGDLNKLSPIEKEGLENGIKEAVTAEKIRVEQEAEAYFQHSKNCGIAAYHEFTQKVPKSEIESIYLAEGRHLENVIRSFGFIPCGRNSNVGSSDGKSPITSIPKYIDTLCSEIKTYKKQYEDSTPINKEEWNTYIKGRTYTSEVDGQQHELTPDNYKYNSALRQKDDLELLVKRMETTLRSFKETAMRLGDSTTVNLVEQALKNLD